jgi:large subunit ribosomal protein L6
LRAPRRAQHGGSPSSEHPGPLFPPWQVEKTTAIFISGADKVAVGDFCALVRRQRPPEPYKGKGVRYSGEVIKLKVGVRACVCVGWGV